VKTDTAIKKHIQFFVFKKNHQSYIAVHFLLQLTGLLIGSFLRVMAP
jgi:hypothetical protein